MSATYRASAAEPLGLLSTDRPVPPAFAGARAQRFEFTSCGDRVFGRLLWPESSGAPCPLILLLGAAGEGREAGVFDSAADWIRLGFAIATLDLALHGERRSPKLSARLLGAIDAPRGDPELDENGCALLREFADQSRCDVVRSLDALATHPAIDASRIGMFGSGFGATLAAIAAAEDARVRAVVLADLRACALDDLDPKPAIARIAPRPLLEHDVASPDATAADFFVETLARALGSG